MSSDLISALALVVSFGSFIWSWRLSKAATSVTVAEKLSSFKITATEAMLVVERQLGSKGQEEHGDFACRNGRLRKILDKITMIMAQLEAKAWPSSSESVVELQEISGSMLEVLRELETLGMTCKAGYASD